MAKAKQGIDLKRLLKGMDNGTEMALCQYSTAITAQLLHFTFPHCLHLRRKLSN